MAEPRPCPLCGHPARPALVARDRNREITGQRFRYDRCLECSTVFIAEPPGDLARFYAGEYYGFEADGQPGWKRSPVLIRAEEYRVALLLRHAGRGPLIEIGSGSGGFAAAARAAGYGVTAIEMDGRCCEYLEHEVGVLAIRSDHPIEVLAGLPSARVIALWHVLEHLIDPAGLLVGAADRLEPGGVLALGLPNPEALQFRLLGPRWPHLDAPRHLNLMPAAAVIAQVAPLGLRPVELTTSDPFGRYSDTFGWTFALRRRPARGATSRATHAAAQLLSAGLAPVERTGLRGAALLLVLRKDG